MKTRLSLLFLLTSFTFLNAQTTLPYSQDFEGSTFPPANWQFFGSNTNASWEHSTAFGGFGNSSSCMLFDNFSSDLSGNYYGIRAAPLDLTNASQPTLKFDVAYARKNASNSDRLGIWYSFNGTSGWTNLTNYQDGNLTTAPDQASRFEPTAAQWDSITIDLTQFAGTSYIRFAFENNCDFGNVMYIDNVRFFDAATVGSEEIEQYFSPLSVYPNPSGNGPVTVNVGNGKPASINLYNQVGAKVDQYSISQQQNKLLQLDLSKLAKGVYFLTVTGQNGSVRSEKIVLE